MPSFSVWTSAEDVSRAIDDIDERLLAAIMAAPGDSLERNHLLLADRHLTAFKEEYMRMVTERLDALGRASQHTVMRVPPIIERRLPTLFVGDQPVLILLIYNMHRVSKKAVSDMLVACGQTHFIVNKVFVQGHRCSARVTCDNLASSLSVQCAALLNKLYFKSGEENNASRRCVKVCPFKERKVTSPSQGVRISKGTPPDCLQALRLDPILKAIIKYLNNVDKLALVTALEGWREPCARIGTIDFDSGCWRYQTVKGFDRMLEDARQFFFTSITIGEWWPMEVSDFQKLLNIIVSKSPGDMKPRSLMSVDLRGVKLTSTVLETLTQNFSIRSLLLGKTTGFFEKRVGLEGIERLAVHDNSMVRLSWVQEYLSPEEKHKETLVSWFEGRPSETLTTLKLTSCPQIRVEPLLNLIENNTTLKELSLTDCSNIDRSQQIWRLPERVFNSSNELRTFRLEHVGLTTEPLEFLHRPMLFMHMGLRELSLKGSRFVEQSLQDFLYNAPALQVVDFTGLDVPQKRLDFSATPFLTTLRLPYHNGIDGTLETLATLKVSEVLVVNTLEKNNKRNRAFNPRFVRDVLPRVPSFSFTAVACKINLSDTTRSHAASCGAYVTPNRGTNFYYLFEIKRM